MNSAAQQATIPDKNGKLVRRLLVVVVLAFAFGFALVPLYDVFCALTGLNGKTSGRTGTLGLGGLTRVTANSAASPVSRIDTDRIITVEFTSTVMPGLPWEMEPLAPRLDLHPGELQQARFRVHNLSGKPITGQAIPSIAPGDAVRHFEKLDCFCFAQQTLLPGESKELTVTFVVKPEIDREIRTITLGYALFNAGGGRD
jgi:cytochrome c oxidase assembly protein subunit 11